MDELEIVVYFGSAVLFLCTLLGVIFLIGIYSGYMILKFRKGRKGQVSPITSDERSTKLKEEQKPELYQQLKSKQDELDRYKSQVESLRKELNQEKLEKHDALKREKEKQEELCRYSSEVATLRDKLHQEKVEKDDALKRLSAIMSSRLRDGNPNVVDLSDQNRPVKVGEQFSELYDNQWTDAYSAIEAYLGNSKQEQEIISILFDVLQQCFMCCKNKSSSQLAELIGNVTNIAAIITKKNSKLSTDLMQRIKEERKMSVSDELPKCDMVLPILKEHFTNNLDVNFLEENALKAFVQECLKLSWLMVIQDPPMAMVMKPEANANDNFKPYKHRGKQVAFVVWPALLLEEGGPLIMKGIAEFKD